MFFIYKDAIFRQERSQEEGKERGFIYVYEQNIIKPNTVGWHCDEQTIICRQLFALHGGNSANEKVDKYASNDSNSYNHHHRHQLFIVIIYEVISSSAAYFLFPFLFHLIFYFSFLGIMARQTFCFSLLVVLVEVLNNGIAQQCIVRSSIFGWMLQRHVYRTVMAKRPHLCLYACREDNRCQSFNFVLSLRMCELNNRTNLARPQDFIPNPDRLHFTRGTSRGKQA